MYPRSLTWRIIILVFLLATLSVSIAGILFYTSSVELVRSQSTLYTRNLCFNLSRDIDDYIEEMERICRIMLSNPNIQQMLEQWRSPGYSDQLFFADREMAVNLVLSFTSVRDSFIIQIFDENGLRIYSDPAYFLSYTQDLFANPWLASKKGDIDDRRLFIVPSVYSELILLSERPAFFVIRPMRRVSDGSILGYLTVTADAHNLLNILRRYAAALPGAELRVVAPENLVLLSLDESEIGTTGKVLDATSVSAISEFSQWRTEIRTSHVYGREQIATTGLFAVLIVILTAAASLFFAWLFTVYLMRPIQRLAEGMAVVGSGDLSITLDSKGVNKDLRPIFSGFNTMVAEIRTLIKKVNEERLLAKSAQLEALQYQINPHFLYNALQTIEAIGEVRDVEEVRVIAGSLGKLFRYNTKGSSMVTLYEEIEQMENYFHVEKIRFGSRINYEFIVPPETRECKVLKFILQPLIENAVVHGFQSITRTGFVRVMVRLNGGDLEIIVEDNGRGMTEEKLLSIERELKKAAEDVSSPAAGDSLGILNVHRRIVNFFGIHYGLRYERNPGGRGMTVIIRLPAIFSVSTVADPGIGNSQQNV
ncbi:histidine kinase [Treponema sp. OttesenSCG-928-L16]|nr:histidine kinase [Treponema sp. OttesenSCG-928-L16]